jgi:HEPN domain-containing protein
MALIVAGCNDSPTVPGEDLWEGDGAAAAAEAVEASWNLLPSADEVQIATFQAVSVGVRKPVAERRIVESATFAVEAENARQAGNLEVAALFEAEAEAGVLAAAAEAFGPNYVSNAIAGVETAIERVEDALRDRPAAGQAREALARARARIAQARSAEASGESAAALGAAVEAAELLREMNPEERARAAVAAAHQLLERAIELAGPDPRPEIADALREAKDHCDAAKRALDAGDWETAFREARECAKIARRVIAILSGGIPDDRLEEHAQEMVAKAAELYERAVEVAGDDPRPEVQRALDHAHELLEKAREALGDGDFREAIRLARESASLSKRIIDALSGGGPAGPGEVTILPYPYPIR